MNVLDAMIFSDVSPYRLDSMQRQKTAEGVKSFDIKHWLKKVEHLSVVKMKEPYRCFCLIQV